MDETTIRKYNPPGVHMFQSPKLIDPPQRPELRWNPELQGWVLTGLCDACRQPYQGGSKKVKVKVFDGPMAYHMETLEVCEDQLKCQSAFRNLLNINGRLRSQRGVSF